MAAGVLFLHQVAVVAQSAIASVASHYLATICRGDEGRDPWHGWRPSGTSPPWQGVQRIHPIAAPALLHRFVSILLG